MKVLATITSKFGGKYIGIPVGTVQDYNIDSGLDTDADSFSINIGDPRSELVEIFKRDSEIRVSLSASLRNNHISRLLTGFVDSAGVTDDGQLSLSGRDWSAVAIDDTAIPGSWHNIRPDKLIESQARVRGFSNFSFATMSPVKSISEDGSESVWAFWYRLVRHKSMWIWTDPAGVLFIDHLNYASAPTYYFGTPTSSVKTKEWIYVTSAEVHKNNQARVGEVWVFGNTGIKSFAPVKIADPRIKDWIKKPLNIVQAGAGITTTIGARKEAQEQIFDGMVGSLEYAVTIRDPGFLIQQNKTAFLNLPSIGISGEFFIVGVHRIGGSDGYTQQIRLREKTYALTRRIPTDPTFDKHVAYYSNTSLGQSLDAQYGQYFVVAAKDWRGAWDFKLFLSALLAIAEQESGIKNIREGNLNGPEWSMPEWINSAVSVGQFLQGSAYTQWRSDFANSKDDPVNPYHNRSASNGEAGVGIMQLTDLSLKQQADERLGKTKLDEFVGGRWNPADNIYIGAKYLAENLQGLPPTESNLWIGIQKYHAGPDPAKYNSPNAITYMKAVRAKMVEAGGTESQVQTAVKSEHLTGQPGSTRTQAVLAGNPPAKVRQIIAAAEGYEGVQYVWGGGNCDGPTKGLTGDKDQPDAPHLTGLDCSGLIAASYGAAGLCDKIGGHQTTYTWWNHGKGTDNLFYVPQDQLLPADMVFFAPKGSNEPPHMGLYYHDNQMIVAPNHTTVVQVQSIGEQGTDVCIGGMRLKGLWPTTQKPSDSTPANSAPAHSSSGAKKVMIQAGHTYPPGSTSTTAGLSTAEDPSINGTGPEPYGHSTQTGATGEIAFSTSVRDKVIALLSSDPHFQGISGTAWDASAGATSSANDDINFDGDLFVSIHYSIGDSGSGAFFGYTRGPTDGHSASLSSESAKLANSIGFRFVQNIPGSPGWNSSLDNSNSRLWGYYAWGSVNRANTVDQVNRVPNAKAAILMECGLASDITFLAENQMAIAKAIYNGICDYYGFKPIGA